MAASAPLANLSRRNSLLAHLEPLQVQLLRRTINEEISGIASDPDLTHQLLELVCECTRFGCSRVVHLAPADYENVRRFPTRFLVKPGHVDFDTERTVLKDEGYYVVEKTGPDAEEAILRDPRKHPLPLEHASGH
jgi:hypothetical protein